MVVTLYSLMFFGSLLYQYWLGELTPERAPRWPFKAMTYLFFLLMIFVENKKTISPQVETYLISMVVIWLLSRSRFAVLHKLWPLSYAVMYGSLFVIGEQR